LVIGPKAGVRKSKSKPRKKGFGVAHRMMRNREDRKQKFDLSSNNKKQLEIDFAQRVRVNQ
jgi:hypothetical protein